MQPSLQITFRGIEPSPFIEARVRELADRLTRFAHRITHCHVSIELPHRHRRQGQLYGVKIRMGVPGREIVVDREGPHDQAHANLHVALRDAFDAAVRRLENGDGRDKHRPRARESSDSIM
jgi:ribosome-associated translation inhibitor RaiA